MNDHFITNIQIKDFKCFDDFKADGLAQINLIGGKNNVGKTAFMEACFVNTHSKNIKLFITALYIIKFSRENLNLLLVSSLSEKDITRKYIEQSKNIYTSTNINISHFKIDDEDGVKKYIFEINEDTSSININDFSFELKYYKNIEFIDNFGFAENQIISNYSSIQKKDEENYLNNILKLLDPKIEAFKIIEDKPQCKVSGAYLDITELGDGVRHIISIITSLYSSENGYLFIDEIDNGIHFTMLGTIWESILTLSKELNVQVFATTHSRECIESFNRTQLKLNNNKSCYFEMARHAKTDAILMQRIDANLLNYELTHQGKYRGE